MASGENYFQGTARTLVPVKGVTLPGNTVQVGVYEGLPLPKSDDDYFQVVFRVPSNGTQLATGITVRVALVDDALNPDVGKVVRLGVSVKRLVSGTDTLDSSGFGTEQTGNVTLDATLGELVAASVAIANAAADSIATGDFALLRIRRIGSNAADTHKGRPLLVAFAIFDT